MNKLSESARVNVNPDLLESGDMTRSHKLELKRKAIKRYVASRNGSIIRFDEFASVAHYRSTPGARSLVQQMVEEGELQQEQVSPKQFAYTVTQSPHEPEAEVTHTKRTVEEETRIAAPFIQSVERMAIQFAWDHDSDSLRGFVKHLKGQSHE